MKKLFLSLLFAIPLWANDSIQHYETISKYAPIRIQVIGPKAAIEKQLDSLLPWIEHFNSTYEADGPLDQMIYNAKVHDTLSLDSTSYELLTFGEKMHQVSEGELDIGIGNLLRAWGLGWGQKRRIPSKSELDSLVQELQTFPFKSLGNLQIEILSPKRHLSMGSYLESRILKEIDLRLKKAGATDWLCEVGGDFSFQGTKPGAIPWVLGMKNPKNPSEIIGSLAIDQKQMHGFSTSGDYEQKFTDSLGQQHHHIFDPRTGKSSTSVHAVSVLSTDPFINDALDTYFMIAPLAKVQSTLAKLKGSAEAILFLDDGKVWVSPGLRTKVNWMGAVELLP